MRRVVVTGLGLITSIGVDSRETWDGLCAGRDGHRDVTLFSTKGCVTSTGAEIPVVPEPDVSRRHLRRMMRVDRLGLLAAEEAVVSAGLNHASHTPERVGVAFGAGATGLLEAQKFFEARRGSARARVRHHLGELQCGTGRWIAWRFGFAGPRICPSTACSSSLTAIGLGARWIGAGKIDAAVVGGAESLSPLTFIGFGSVGAMSEHPCRPFDRNRSGMSLGEGGAALVLEEREAARRRGAPILAEIRSFATSADAHHMTAPHPEGLGAALAIRRCLEESGIPRERIDLVSAHGTGTPANDLAECAALRSTFGSHAERLPVISQKGAFGHCLGAAGAMECAAAVLAIVNRTIPPNLRIAASDPECGPFEFPGRARAETKIDAVLKQSFGFGGSNAALILAREDVP